jgi:hypothetical protein
MYHFDSPSRLVSLIKHFGYDVIVVDQNLNMLHNFSGYGEYLGSYKQYDVNVALDPSVFAGRGGIPLFCHPQSLSSSMYNSGFISYIDFGVANAWLANSGFIRFLPGVDIRDLIVTKTFSDVIFEFTQIGNCKGSAKIYDQSNSVVYDFGEYELYSGRLIGSVPQSTLGDGTFTFKISALPICNDDYGIFAQKPVELSKQFSINHATISLSLSRGWNLVSVPLLQSNYSASAVFPGKSGSVFAFNTASRVYEAKETLVNGSGYWVLYGAPTAISITGTTAGPQTVTVTQAGWALVGSHETVLSIDTLVFSNGASKVGSVFHWNTFYRSYQSTTVISPGEGVWVLVKNDTPGATWPCTITIP